MITGSCLCGGVRYVVDAPFSDVTHCHCNMCQKMHGAAFGTYGETRRDGFRWTDGGDLIGVYASSPGVERRFCRRCGSTLHFQFDLEPDLCYVTLGSVDGDPGARPKSHIFAGSKAPWHEITDDLPQFDEWTDGFLPK
jgi:hypothetical protein